MQGDRGCLATVRARQSAAASVLKAVGNSCMKVGAVVEVIGWSLTMLDQPRWDYWLATLVFSGGCTWCDLGFSPAIGVPADLIHLMTFTSSHFFRFVAEAGMCPQELLLCRRTHPEC